MASSNRPGGRNKRIVGGGGNAYKRGSGLGGGSVGGGSRPSGGGFSGGTSGNRGSGGGGLLAILLALLLGNSSGSTSKGGCLKRILILVVIVAVGSFLLRSCSGGGLNLGGLLGGGMTDYSDPTGGLTSVQEAPAADSGSPSTGGASSMLESILGAYGGTTGTLPAASSSEPVYAAHEPDYTVDTAARTKYVNTANAQSVTIMVYMCGADLESRSGMATYDLQEMASATLNDNVRIIVETGGASRWQNDVVKSGTNMRFRVLQGGLKTLDNNVGRRSMVEPDTLSDFIRYAKRTFPADRYMLIFWNHGGGSITGYGYDELFPNASMTLDGINAALKDGDCKFDLIGFDACLMATLETALVAEQYADYFIASEATEPGTGWYYTTWLSKLSADPSMSTVDVGKQIVDDFVKYSAQGSSSNKATLSLLDLAELSGTVPAAFTSFSNSTGTLIENDGYEQVASARSSARDFSAGSKINQIDLIHFADNLGTKESAALATALRGCVKYNRNSSNITHANGISIYFPYNSLSKVSTAIKTYNAIGLDKSYTECIRSFASVASAGQVTSGSSADALGTLLGDSSGSLLGSLLGGSLSGGQATAPAGASVADLLSLFLDNRSVVTGDRDSSWVNEDLVMKSASYLEKNNAGFGNLMLTYKGDTPTLVMSEAQWDAVVTLEQNVFIDDGEGYIDLGLDNVMEYDEDDDLIMAYDGTWMSLNGQIVAYYLVSDDRIDESYSIIGRVPAMLNGTRVNIMLSFTPEEPYGTVLGAQTDYEATTDTVMKGLLAINAGDKIDFLCDYYNYDGTFSDSYYLGEQMTATGEWIIGNAPLGDGVSWQMTYRITDAFGGQYWTPTITNSN